MLSNNNMGSTGFFSKIFGRRVDCRGAGWHETVFCRSRAVKIIRFYVNS